MVCPSLTRESVRISSKHGAPVNIHKLKHLTNQLFVRETLLDQCALEFYCKPTPCWKFAALLQISKVFEPGQAGKHGMSLKSDFSDCTSMLMPDTPGPVISFYRILQIDIAQLHKNKSNGYQESFWSEIPRTPPDDLQISSANHFQVDNHSSFNPGAEAATLPTAPPSSFY